MIRCFLANARKRECHRHEAWATLFEGVGLVVTRRLVQYSVRQNTLHRAHAKALASQRQLYEALFAPVRWCLRFQPYKVSFHKAKSHTFGQALIS
jgi:hypothetical protein